MRGISNIVLLLLVLVITIASISVLWLYFYGAFKRVVSSGNTSTLSEALSSCMRIDSVKDNKIYLRNCGPGIIKNSDIRVYMDEGSINFSMNPNSIGEGNISTIDLYNIDIENINLGNHKLKVTTKAEEIGRYVKASMPSCDSPNTVLCLNFDEGSGNKTYDSSLYGNNGVLGDRTCNPGAGTCPIWVDGEDGKALKFDGANDYVNVTNSSSLCMKSKITITAWINPTFQKNYNTIIERQWSANGDFWFGLGAANILFALNNDTGASVYDYYSMTLMLGQWYFVAAAYNGSAMTVYLNGQSGTSYAQNGTFSNCGDYIIGNQPAAGSYFNGTIDDLRIYNTTNITLTLLDTV